MEVDIFSVVKKLGNKGKQMEKQIDEKKKKKKKKKGDRCVRIAKRKYDVWPSAYASGAVVKCRKGKIWKGLKEEELNEMVDEELEKALEEGIKDFLTKGIGAGLAAATLAVSTPAAAQDMEKPAAVQQDKQEAKIVKQGGKLFIGDHAHKNKAYEVSNRFVRKGLSNDPYVKEQLGKLKKQFPGKLLYTQEISDGNYTKVQVLEKKLEAGQKIVNINSENGMRDQWQQVEDSLGKDWEKNFTGEFWGPEGKGKPTHFIYKEVNLKEEKKKKPDFKKEKESGLHGWFSRQGGKGKSKGWVDCNTCRKDKKTGKKTCKTCGRKEGEKRAKYPSCRPKPSDCGSSGKGKEWGKKSAKKESLQNEESLLELLEKDLQDEN